ncbi:2-keto-4-pentenoate hydratase/2-oxohepta-3-ene-1,7-dioic acid hydratase in catechol pathway [Sphingobium xenophagum]|uniref:2-keto-4-pentenoate hydratase/2-oxohepta-3-ene-1,7-dioic acid hydratase in catechol pathway n=1 Tax=Sphingobium xenophagum TaxID=121428 RepID=A0ABU1WYG1_SPHXE|nr:fumarylacetoacetate hydrolase family protein [Sphingobium xenophagum]MDR7154345.1 2-keto-4-pentenoate hydratase/2-oxohepta-3-ene-1,7-dioic acid hydratase in catechol pathway [Sphingobium xenophagum]
MTQEYAIGTASHGQRTFACVIQGERVWELARLPGMAGFRDTLAVFEVWHYVDQQLAVVMQAPPVECAIALADVRLEAPLRPRQIFCTGANYRKHVAELTAKQSDPSTAGMTPEERVEMAYKMMEGRARNGTPYAFVKLPSAVTGPYDHIILPNGVEEPDWELELGVVIGRSARHISREDALSVVAGFLVTNDISSRDRIYRSDMKAIGTDWLSSKCQESFLPTGPWIKPARFVPDPQNLQITLKLNGKIMQDESTADMIFDVARQIEYLSSLVRLLPGDIICTGSPAGNGTHYQRFLQPGDVVEGTITGLGTQRLTCIREPVPA